MGARSRIGLLLAFLAAGCDAGIADGPATGQSAAPSSAVPGATARPSFSRPTPLPSPTFLSYEVQSGDSLTSIARQFGTTARSIAYWNRDRYPSLDPDSSGYEPDRIKVGWILVLIPTHEVDEDELLELAPSPGESAVPSAGTTPGPS